jgi:hypothetical protein
VDRELANLILPRRCTLLSLHRLTLDDGGLIHTRLCRYSLLIAGGFSTEDADAILKELNGG